MSATILLWFGLAAALMAFLLSWYDQDRAVRNWNTLQMVTLWIYFLLK